MARQRKMQLSSVWRLFASLWLLTSVSGTQPCAIEELFDNVLSVLPQDCVSVKATPIERKDLVISSRSGQRYKWNTNFLSGLYDLGQGGVG